MIDKNSTKEYLTQLLRNDVKAFNQYRINADYRGIDLRWANLCGADLGGAVLGGANLREANLCEANLCEVNLREADLSFVEINKFQVKDILKGLFIKIKRREELE